MIRGCPPSAVGLPHCLDLAVLHRGGLGGPQPLHLGVEDRLRGGAGGDGHGLAQVGRQLGVGGQAR
eukprot:3350938-Pyramimonas_sp.AAC.1